MNVELKQIRKKDFGDAIRFAIEGLHFSDYATKKTELFLYSRYFWYGMILKATDAVGAYRSEEHTSELQSHLEISYAVFCCKKKTIAMFVL